MCLQPGWRRYLWIPCHEFTTTVGLGLWDVKWFILMVWCRENQERVMSQRGYGTYHVGFIDDHIEFLERCDTEPTEYEVVGCHVRNNCWARPWLPSNV